MPSSAIFLSYASQDADATRRNCVALRAAGLEVWFDQSELRGGDAWGFSSLHTSVGMAFVVAVVGEYLGSAKGVGYLIHQAEGSFDINTVFAGILVLTVFALLLDFAVTFAENKQLMWRPQHAETETT